MSTVTESALNAPMQIDVFAANQLDNLPVAYPEGLTVLSEELYGPLLKPFSSLLERQFPQIPENVRKVAEALLHRATLRYRKYLALQLGKIPDDAVYLRGAAVRRERYSGMRGEEYARQIERIQEALRFTGMLRGRDDRFQSAFYKLSSLQDMDVAFYCPAILHDDLEISWEAIRLAFGITNLHHIRVGESTYKDSCVVELDDNVVLNWDERIHSGGLRHAYLYLYSKGNRVDDWLILDVALAFPDISDTRFGPAAQFRDRALKTDLIAKDDSRLYTRNDTQSPFADPRYDAPAAFMCLGDDIGTILSSSLRGMVDGALWPPTGSVINSDNGYGMTSYQFDQVRIRLLPSNCSVSEIRSSTRRYDEILKDMVRLKKL